MGPVSPAGGRPPVRCADFADSGLRTRVCSCLGSRRNLRISGVGDAIRASGAGNRNRRPPCVGRRPAACRPVEYRIRNSASRRDGIARWKRALETGPSCLASAAPSRRFPPSPPTRRGRLDLREPRVEEPDLARVPDPSAVEQTADDDPGGLELSDVRRDQRAHVAGPGRHVRAGGVLGHRAGVAQRERGVPEPVLRHHRRVCEPRPAPVRVFQEPPVNELEHRALPAGVGHRPVQPRRREQGRVGPGVEIDDRVEPSCNPLVVELHERDARPRLAVVDQEPEHKQPGERRLVAQRRDVQHAGRGDRPERPGVSPRVRPPRVPADLERERCRQHPPQRQRHRGDGPLAGTRRPTARESGRDHGALR